MSSEIPFWAGPEYEYEIEYQEAVASILPSVEPLLTVIHFPGYRAPDFVPQHADDDESAINTPRPLTLADDLLSPPSPLPLRPIATTPAFAYILSLLSESSRRIVFNALVESPGSPGIVDEVNDIGHSDLPSKGEPISNNGAAALIDGVDEVDGGVEASELYDESPAQFEVLDNNLDVPAATQSVLPVDQYNSFGYPIIHPSIEEQSAEATSSGPASTFIPYDALPFHTYNSNLHGDYNVFAPYDDEVDDALVVGDAQSWDAAEYVNQPIPGPSFQPHVEQQYHASWYDTSELGDSGESSESSESVGRRPQAARAPVVPNPIYVRSDDSDAEDDERSEDSSDEAATDNSSDESESEAESEASPLTASHSAPTSLSRGHAAREERLHDIVNTPKQAVQIRKGNKRARENSDDEYGQGYDVSGRDKAAGSSRPPAKRGKKDESLPTKNQIRKLASYREWVEMPGLPTILKYDGYYPCPVKTCNHGYKPVKGSVQVHFRLYHADVLLKAGGRSVDNDKMDCIFRSEMEPCKPYKLQEYGRHMLYWHWKPMTHKCKTCEKEFYARETVDVRNHVSACEQRRPPTAKPKDRKGKGRA